MGKKQDNNRERPGKYAYENLTRVIHEKARLGIITSLLGNRRGLSFNELKKLCDLSDGNLSRHMQVLEQYGFVEVHKGFEGRKPRTDYKLTAFGEQEFMRYLADLERVIADARQVINQRVLQTRES